MLGEHYGDGLLRSYGYGFNNQGCLRILDSNGDLTDSAFEFQQRPEDFEYNQRRYEVLGDAITQYIYSMLEFRCGLIRLNLIGLPSGCGDSFDSSFIFASPDWNQASRVLLLIHGSGVVRAGQWSRKLIINNNLNVGSMLPFIETAKNMGMAVIVANTNDNTRRIDGVDKEICGSENPTNHAFNLWKKYVVAKHVAIVAHSYGGVVVANLADRLGAEFIKKVFSVSFTDSVHSDDAFESDVLREHMRKIAVNYVAHPTLEVGQFVDRHDCIVKCLSAGHPQHEWTSFSAFDAIFKRIKEQMKHL